MLDVQTALGTGEISAMVISKGDIRGKMSNIHDVPGKEVGLHTRLFQAPPRPPPLIR